ncbi:hypothetical protein L7F22_005273 [Adiantum nelumboides]|nr:hypothetical protein [Adiantum nelumboides]
MDMASACWAGAAEACRRGGKELGAIVLSLPTILFYHHRSSHASTLILTHRYVVGLFAFLISVDLVEIVGILCYQLFTVNYFPWHLYPLMLNRAAELLSLLCAQGQILTAIFVTVIVMKLAKLPITNDEGQPASNWTRHADSTTGHNSMLFGISRRERGSRVHDVPDDVLSTVTPRLTLQKMLAIDAQDMDSDIILAVEQPDGRKVNSLKWCIN